MMIARKVGVHDTGEYATQQIFYLLEVLNITIDALS